MPASPTDLSSPTAVADTEATVAATAVVTEPPVMPDMADTLEALAEVPALAVDSLPEPEPLPPSRVEPLAWEAVDLEPATPLVPRLLLELQESNKSSLVVGCPAPKGTSSPGSHPRLFFLFQCRSDRR